MRTPQKHKSLASTSGAIASSSSGGGGGGPSPSRLTRGALKNMEEGEARLSPALKDPEPKKGRKMCRTIVIEYTGGAPRLFREKAREIKTELLMRVAQVEVLINGHDDRPGCFVVREEDDDQVFLEFLDMETPFDPLRDLDVIILVEGIAQALLTGNPFDYEAFMNDDQQ